MLAMRGVIAELQRRHVIRAAVAHVVAFWLFIQVADVVLPHIGVVQEPVRWALIAGVALFPVTLIVAWFSEHPWHRFTRSRLAVDAVVILVVAVTAGAWVLRSLPQVVHTRTSIVILPFETSGNSLEQNLSRALVYEVNSLLMKSRSIDVIGLESSTSPLLDGLDPAGIAARLKVMNLLTGSVAASDGDMRIDLRLLDSAGRLLWNTVIVDSLDNLFSVQERVAAAIESRLGSGDEARPVAMVAAQRCRMPADPDALQKYYTARYYIELRSDTDESHEQIREAIAMYQELVGAYPDFAEAYSGLAWAYMHQAVYDPAHALPDARRAAIDAAEKALALCPTLTEAIHHTANEYDHANPWIGAWQQLTAFIDMEPQRLENYQRLSRHYQESGLLDHALELAERNYALDPLSPRAITQLASIRQQLGQYDVAIELYDQAAELGSTGPNFARAAQQWTACGDDLRCKVRAWPLPEQVQEALLAIMQPPAGPDGQKRAIRRGLELLAVSPDNFTNMLNAVSCEADHLTPLYFRVWAESRAQGAYWHWPNTWNSNCGNIWSSPAFPVFAQEVGLVEYWRVAGWPTMCRPAGDGVVCGEPSEPARR